jgi:aspartate/methionine/tyrosine aminotransferase
LREAGFDALPSGNAQGEGTARAWRPFKEREGRMKLEEFRMERMQSSWENVVLYNLSESGVHPVELGQLLTDPQRRQQLLGLQLGYGQSNGTAELRRLIASLYPGAGEENILVTSGSSEANFIATWSLIEPGDEVLMMMPNYMQIWGLARGFGAKVRPFHLIEERGWAPDLEELEGALSHKTKLIAICNPNNPTGAILSDAEIDRIVEAARGVKAWILADEVYRGAERDGNLAPSFWGRYDKLIITSGLSKAYGLAGLRIGWIASRPEMVARAWSYHDYTTISPAAASDFLARAALENKEKLLERTRRILNSNYPILRRWADSHNGLFHIVDPKAGAIAYLRYELNMGSLELVERLRQEKSVLIVPGEHFLMGNYLRIGYGATEDCLRAGLELISDFLSGLRAQDDHGRP